MVSESSPSSQPTENAALAADSWTALSRPLERVIGKRSANALEKLGLETVEDLINHVPFRLAARGELLPIEAVSEGESVTVVAQVMDSHLRPMNNRRGFILNVTISDGEHELDLTFFGRSQRPLAFHKSRLIPGAIATFSGTISSYRGRLQLAHPEYEIVESEADVDPEKIAQPIPIYHAGAKVPSWHIQRAVATVLGTLAPSDVPDPLPDDYRKAHDLPDRYAALHMIHQPQTIADFQRAQHRMAHEEAFVLQAALAQRAAQAAEHHAPACARTTGGIADTFDAQLPFTLTPSQVTVGQELSAELAGTAPMRRLLQGDVGSGKTIVAVRAMIQVVEAGHQAVLLAPTEVLARQHAQNIRQMLGESLNQSVPVSLLIGSLTTAQRRATLAKLASGVPGIVVATHAVLSDGVQLPSLGLVVVDEQHRFGVDQRDRLAHGAHLLVMTATPIPRTVAMTVFGDLDVSVLDQRERAVTTTTVVPADNDLWMARVWQRAREEISGGGCVFVVCARISPTEIDDDAELVAPQLDLLDDGSAPARDMADVETLSARLAALPVFADTKIAVLHGKLSAAEKTAVMDDVAQGRTQLLVATTVIEVGVDIAQATMMIIMDAERFGLSQLHQLRGRVGRGDRPGLCLAVTGAVPGTQAAERVAAFARTTNGFDLAEADVALRSVGDVLGAEQSGRHSSLRYVSVVDDKLIIDQARQAARAVVAADPLLAQHRALAVAIADLSADSRQYLEKS